MLHGYQDKRRGEKGFAAPPLPRRRGRDTPGPDGEVEAVAPHGPVS